VVGTLNRERPKFAFALKFEGRKRQHDADAFMADIVAKRLVRYLERARYVVMKRPPLGGHSAIGRGFGALGQNPVSLTGFDVSGRSRPRPWTPQMGE